MAAKLQAMADQLANLQARANHNDDKNNHKGQQKNDNYQPPAPQGQIHFDANIQEFIPEGHDDDAVDDEDGPADQFHQGT